MSDEKNMSLRLAKLTVARTKSSRATGLHRVAIGDESFVYEGGKLVEYDRALPVGYLDLNESPAYGAGRGDK